MNTIRRLAVVNGLLSQNRKSLFLLNIKENILVVLNDVKVYTSDF